jgi:putative transposase
VATAGIEPLGAIGSSPMARAVVESFFNLLKRERIRRRKYKTREEARQDVFDYIAFFYNPQRKHVRNGMLSPIDFEQQQKLKLKGIWQTRGYST